MKRRINEIISVTSSIFGVTPEQVASKNRQRDVVSARQTAMYYAMKYFASKTMDDEGYISIIKLSKHFNRHYSTLLHSVKVCENLRDTETDFKEKLEQIGCMTKGIAELKQAERCKYCDKIIQYHNLRMCNDCYAKRQSQILELRQKDLMHFLIRKTPTTLLKKRPSYARWSNGKRESHV